MSCRRPLIRMYNPNDHNITGQIASLEKIREYTHNPKLTYEDFVYLPNYMLIPCGKCIGCRLRMRQDWATRMELEAKQWKPGQVWFVTWTYDNKHVPGMIRETGEIVRGIGHSWKASQEAPKTTQILLMSDIQLFIKKLRRRQETAKNRIWGTDLRYFMCGEYGEKTGRPHYHAILYGLEIPDSKKMKGQNPYWQSESLTKLWGMGEIILAEATPETYNYVSGYVTKKMYGQDNKRYRELGLTVPYATMSRRPGLADEWFQQNYEKLWHDDKIYLAGGKTAPVPRYMEKKLEAIDCKRLWEMKRKRQQSAMISQKLQSEQTDLPIEQQKIIRDEILKQKFKKSKGML